MRTAFFKVIEELSQVHNDTYLLSADLGFKLFDDFRDKHPTRFINVGVAESNMIGIAAGLSLSGKNVYCYSIIPFLVMRAFEQVRIDIAYQNLNIKLIGVGGGFTYGAEGFTHFAVEDLSLMRSLPNIAIVAPADLREAEQLARISYDYPYPLYIRLGKNGDPIIHNVNPAFNIGKGSILQEGKNVAMLAIGSAVYLTKQATEILKKDGVSATLINMHTLKPLDIELIKECTLAHDVIFTVEEHCVVGGLGSAVAEVLSETSYRGIFRRIGIPVNLKKFVGHADFLRKQYGLAPEKIAEKVLNELKVELWIGG